MSETIKLNGEIFNREKIADLKTSYESTDSWLISIYEFLTNWFDNSDFIISHTSGSTGTPKEIRLLKTAMRNSALMTNAFFSLDETKTALLCLPASYIAGKMMLVRAIVGGFNLIIVEPKANPFENIDFAIDFTAITPYQLTHSIETLKSKTVQNIIVGGGQVNAKLEALVTEIPAKMYETYGMTETASHIALRCFNGNQKSDYFTVLDGVSIRQEERDCLAILATHLSEKELITNDMIELKDSKSFRWLGRLDSVINSAGVKIHPKQLEKKLEEYIPSNFFITSVPDEFLENKVVLVIESEEFTPEKFFELNTFCKENLSKYEIPKQIFYLPTFIYSESNKILRNETLSKAISLTTT